MTAQEYWDIMPLESKAYKINVIEDLCYKELLESGQHRKGFLARLDKIEVEPVEELSNPLVMMRFCDEMIHSVFCSKKVRNKFFTKKLALCQLLTRKGFGYDYVAHGAKYISFKVGNGEKIVTKRKKLFKECKKMPDIKEGFDFVKESQDNLPTPFSVIPFMLFFVAVDFAREMNREDFGKLCNLI